MNDNQSLKEPTFDPLLRAAIRHLSDLLDKGCIEKLPGGGRSTRYQIPSIVMKSIMRDD